MSLTHILRPDRETACPSPSSTELKNECSYTSAPPLCLHGVKRDSFTLTHSICETWRKETTREMLRKMRW